MRSRIILGAVGLDLDDHSGVPAAPEYTSQKLRRYFNGRPAEIGKLPAMGGHVSFRALPTGPCLGRAGPRIGPVDQPPEPLPHYLATLAR